MKKMFLLTMNFLNLFFQDDYFFLLRKLFNQIFVFKDTYKTIYHYTTYANTNA